MNEIPDLRKKFGKRREQDEQLTKAQIIEQLKLQQQRQNIEYNSRINALQAATSTFHTEQTNPENILRAAAAYYDWIVQDISSK